LVAVVDKVAATVGTARRVRTITGIRRRINKAAM
jgi:hypothetical protein